ncbi:hypothetical protein B0H14DRAFT_3461068 [Mycena olivaceomarginata]|nr:hypothetical protein B0H14DRAFT_3461068 [Mycena olivaceomarginata]
MANFQREEELYSVIDIKEIVAFFDSLAGLPWSDRAPNSAYTRISAFYARLADDARFRLGHSPAAAPPAFGGARGISAGRVPRRGARAARLERPGRTEILQLLDGFPMRPRALRMGRAVLLCVQDAGVPECKGESARAGRDAGRVCGGCEAVDDDAEGARSALSGVSGENDGWDGVRRAIEKKLNEERQRQKAKKKEKKRRSKGNW